MKAIHNSGRSYTFNRFVVLYLKDTQKWKQFTTTINSWMLTQRLCYISKILKNESNSQLLRARFYFRFGCVISQRYSKMKAIHNCILRGHYGSNVVLYLKDTQKWKQFTTTLLSITSNVLLCYISKILKNESNSQQWLHFAILRTCCVISQRYSKMKAIHNVLINHAFFILVVLYLKDTQKWKQFTTELV